MKSKVIIINEGASWLYIDDNGEYSITQRQFKELQNYLNNTFGNLEMLLLKPDKIMFVNYVGFINLSNLYIEILPKVSLGNETTDRDRARLVEMLIKCKDLPVKLDYNLQVVFKSHTLLDLFTKIFIKELGSQMNKGVYRQFRTNEDNLQVLKGKLILKDHVRSNYYNKSKAYCSYDDFTENNPLNMTFKATLKILHHNTLNSTTMSDLNKLIWQLANVNDIEINPDLLNNIQITRQNNRFEKALSIAKLIILKLYSKSSHGKNQSFSMLFEMNILFEKYIAMVTKQLYNNQITIVKTQDKGKYLLQNQHGGKAINLKPDIVIEAPHSTIIIDTKWKNIKKREKLNYALPDIYQMYAYVTSYPQAEKCILLYPRTGEPRDYPSWNLFPPYEDRVIEIKDVRLDYEKNTVEDLGKISKTKLQA